MTEITFTISHQSEGARTGKLLVNGQIIATPALVYPATILEKLPASVISQLGIAAVKVAGLKWWLRFDQQQLQAIGDLHRVLTWKKLLLVDPETKVAYQRAKARGMKKDGVRFRDQKDHLHFYQPADGQRLQEELGADLIMSFSRAVDYFAPVDDLVAGVKQSINWLPATPAEQAQTIGLITGGGLKHPRQHSIAAINEGKFAAAGIAGIPSDLPSTEFQRIIQEISLQLTLQPFRYLLTTVSLKQLLIAVSAGVDLIDSDLALKMAKRGIALSQTNYGEIKLTAFQFATDQSQLEPGCGCPTCQAGYQRAYLHQLVVDRAPLGEQLLLVHNLFVMNKLMTDLRQAINTQQLKTFCQNLQVK